MFRSIFLMAIVVTIACLGASSFLANRVAHPSRSRPTADFTPSAAQQDAAIPQSRQASAGSAQLTIAPDRSGNYLTDVEIDGRSIHMVVDTGATYVSLTNADASAIGIDPAPADFKYRTMTANGAGVAAKVRIDTLRLGQMEVDDVEAFVMPPGAMGTSLLGMSALSRLGSVEISGGQLVLRQ